MYSELFYLNECVEGVYIRTDAAEPSEIARKSDTIEHMAAASRQPAHTITVRHHP